LKKSGIKTHTAQNSLGVNQHFCSHSKQLKRVAKV
jgi:hypothetical protein